MSPHVTVEIPISSLNLITTWFQRLPRLLNLSKYPIKSIAAVCTAILTIIINSLDRPLRSLSGAMQAHSFLGKARYLNTRKPLRVACFEVAETEHCNFSVGEAEMGGEATE